MVGISLREIWSILYVSCKADSWWFFQCRSTSLRAKIHKCTKMENMCQPHSESKWWREHSYESDDSFLNYKDL